MSRNNTLQNALLISGAIIDDALAAEIATLDAEGRRTVALIYYIVFDRCFTEEGEEKRHIMPPEELRKHLPQWSEMPRIQSKENRNRSVTTPQKLTHPSTGGQLGTRDRGLHEPHDQSEASRATDGAADSAYTSTSLSPQTLLTRTLHP
jgi:hypothetical protein